MAPVDPECTGDRKLICESLVEEPYPDIPESTVLDYPPESFWLSKDAEYDWFDRNAFLDRKQSIKGNSSSMNPNPIVTPSHSTAIATSLQFSSFLKSKPAIIGVHKQHKTNHADSIHSKRKNCKLANILLFPKRLDSIGKEPAVASMTEPSSPKVSCLGRVRSKRYRKPKKSANFQNEEVQKTGFMCCLRSLFRSGCGKNTNRGPSSECLAPGRNNGGCDRLKDEPGGALGGVTRSSTGGRRW